MITWDLPGLDITAGRPEVLHSAPQGRAIAIHLEAGQALADHQVREGAWLMVASGRVSVIGAQEGGREMGPGGLAFFEPAERHAVSAIDDAQVLLLLTPWPVPDREPEAR